MPHFGVITRHIEGPITRTEADFRKMSQPQMRNKVMKFMHRAVFLTLLVYNIGMKDLSKVVSFAQLVKLRRSVRRYSAQPVPRQVIDKCLEAARLAPSACNSQPWSFIVVDDEKVKNEIVDRAMSGIYRMNAFVKAAPVLIVVVTEHSRYIARLGGMLRSVKYNLIDIGIAGDHLTLQAAELGLGTCWLGWFNERAVKKVLGLSPKQRVDIMISLGYPLESGGPLTEKNRRPLDEIRRFYQKS
jgi:nitroreductase